MLQLCCIHKCVCICWCGNLISGVFFRFFRDPGWIGPSVPWLAWATSHKVCKLMAELCISPRNWTQMKHNTRWILLKYKSATLLALFAWASALLQHKAYKRTSTNFLHIPVISEAYRKGHKQLGRRLILLSVVVNTLSLPSLMIFWWVVYSLMSHGIYSNRSTSYSSK